MRLRLLPGRVIIREFVEDLSEVLWVPDIATTKQVTHRGEVMAMGPPALVCRVDNMGRCQSLTCRHAEVPYHFEVGDVVQYHLDYHQAAHTHEWEAGVYVTIVPQRNVDAVLEGYDRAKETRSRPSEAMSELRKWAS